MFLDSVPFLAPVGGKDEFKGTVGRGTAGSIHLARYQVPGSAPKKRHPAVRPKATAKQLDRRPLTAGLAKPPVHGLEAVSAAVMAGALVTPFSARSSAPIRGVTYCCRGWGRPAHQCPSPTQTWRAAAARLRPQRARAEKGRAVAGHWVLRAAAPCGRPHPARGAIVDVQRLDGPRRESKEG